MHGSVFRPVEQNAERTSSVTARAARFLDILLERRGCPVVKDIADVGLINTKPERTRRNHDRPTVR
jgi:hypothetical protein